ncbi:hypothetical protein E5676_scaffold609G001340 [Cucumis melo var. makuwa]|uniref:Ty3-gypsy retrotransposon protein n=1 Tax=Cucumis melo var. makuwa TaxID=1194695 RepID=A0A5A7UE59_CUCMM|nr:hypothetical protein E6C27_scaffold60G001830 [Cucumis melo var. makuwa]TYK21458.1 hypothetical protein E5676_scaffold609G001340 [Cucumis melo var. makuwa]
MCEEVLAPKYGRNEVGVLTRENPSRRHRFVAAAVFVRSPSGVDRKPSVEAVKSSRAPSSVTRVDSHHGSHRLDRFIIVVAFSVRSPPSMSSPVVCLPSRSIARTRTRKPKPTLVVAITRRIVLPSPSLSPSDLLHLEVVAGRLPSVTPHEAEPPVASHTHILASRTKSRAAPSRARARAIRVSFSRVCLLEPPCAHEPPVRATFCFLAEPPSRFTYFLATSLILCSFPPVLDSLDQVILERGISPVKVSIIATSTSSKTSLLGKRDFVVRTHLSKSPVRRNRQSDIDIDMIRVVRRDRSQPDCLSVSSGYTTDQIVLSVPLGSPKTSYVPLGSHVARVWERVSRGEVRAKASWRATRSNRGEP